MSSQQLSGKMLLLAPRSVAYPHASNIEPCLKYLVFNHMPHHTSMSTTLFYLPHLLPAMLQRSLIMLMTITLAGSARGCIIYLLKTPVPFTRGPRLAKYTNKTSCGAFKVLTDGNVSLTTLLNKSEFLTQDKTILLCCSPCWDPAVMFNRRVNYKQSLILLVLSCLTHRFAVKSDLLHWSTPFYPFNISFHMVLDRSSHDPLA